MRMQTLKGSARQLRVPVGPRVVGQEVTAPMVLAGS